MLKGHFIGVVTQLVKGIDSSFAAWDNANILIADVDAGAETGKVDVDPVRVLGEGVEEAAVSYYIGIYRIFKTIGKASLIKGLILMSRKVYFEITPSFGGEHAIAGKKGNEG